MERLIKKETERENEEKFKNLVESMPLPILISRVSDGLVLFENKLFGPFFGFPIKSLLNTRTPDLYADPHDRFNIIKKLKKEGRLDGHEAKGKKRNGEIFDVTFSMKFIKYNGEESLITTFLDTTEQKRTEEKLRHQASLLENVHDAIMSTDMNGEIISWNKGAEKMFGWKEEEILGKSIFPTIIPNDELSKLKEAGQKTVSEGNWKGEFIEIRKDGTRFPCFVSLSVIKDKNNKPVGMICVDTDITERKKAEENIRILKEKYENLYNNAPVMCASLNMDGIIIECNNTILNKLGYTKREFIDAHITKFMTKESAAKFKKYFPEMLKMGELLGAERKLITKSSKIIDVILNVTVEYDENQKPIGTRAIFEDITDRKKSKQEIISLKEYITKIEKLEKAKKTLSEKVTKLTKKIPLTENEKLVFYGLVKYPSLNDQQLAKELKIKRPTITAIKNKLLRQDFYSTYIIPNFELIGCDLLCIINGKTPIEDAKKRNIKIFENMVLSPEIVYNINTDKEFLSIVISKNFVEIKKLVDALSIIYEKDDMEKPNIIYLPFTMSKIMNFFDYSSLLKSLFNLKIKNEPKKLINSIKKKLSDNEKIILYVLTKYPNFTDIEIAAKTKISRSTVSNIKKNLINENFLKIINIPNNNKLNCELIVYSNTKIDLKKINKENQEIPSLIFMISSERESGNIFAFEDYTKYKIEFGKLASLFKKEEPIGHLFPTQQIRFNKIDFAPLVKKIFELRTNF